MPANSNDPFRRIGSNSWKELLDQVNDELQDPPDGCDPIAPIEVPGPEHRWAKSDIREVHDKLDEMPEDCFVWADIPDLWKTSIISDIEEQLPEAWCDCESEDCCYPCPNCGERSTIFLGTDTVDADDCTSCSCTQGDLDFCFDELTSGSYGQALSDFNEYPVWAFYQYSWCFCQEELEELNDELEQLEDQLERLEENLADCAGDPDCIAATQAQIDAKNDEIDAKEEEIEEKETECAEFEAERDEAKGKAEGACASLNTALLSMVCCASPIFDLVGGSHPVPPALFECPDPENNVSGQPNPSCCGDDFWRCRTGFAVYRKGYGTVRTGCGGKVLTPYVGTFRFATGGVHDPVTGAPCPTFSGVRVGVCAPEHTVAYCYSNNCCAISPCGACCANPNNDWNVDYEERLAPPRCGNGEEDCSGGPCGDEEQ